MQLDPCPHPRGKGLRSSEPVISDQVEAALRQLLSEEVAELAKNDKGGASCWPAVLLEIAAKQSRTPSAPRHPLAHLITQILDLRHTVPEEHRTEVARFCRKLAAQASQIGLGRLHRLKKLALPFVEEVLRPLGEDRLPQDVTPALGRHLTIQQLMSRLDPHQPLELQAFAVKVLPDIVGHELRIAPRVAQERHKTLQSLHQAVGMVGSTKYFESLAPKMRDACETQMNDLRDRIEKAGRRY